MTEGDLGLGIWDLGLGIWDWGLGNTLADGSNECLKTARVDPLLSLCLCVSNASSLPRSMKHSGTEDTEICGSHIASAAHG